MVLQFCPQDVARGDAAAWAGVVVALLAAGATLAAVIVALKTSGQAREQLKELRDEEALKADGIRLLRARAYSAAIVDEMQRALRHISVARDLLDRADATSFERAFAALEELSEIDTAFLQRMLEHVEVFGTPGKILGRMTVMLMEHEHSGKRNLRILERRVDVPHDFIASQRTKLDTDILYLRGVAPLFYDMAEMSQNSRTIEQLTDEERQRLFGQDAEDTAAGA